MITIYVVSNSELRRIGVYMTELLTHSIATKECYHNAMYLPLWDEQVFSTWKNAIYSFGSAKCLYNCVNV